MLCHSKLNLTVAVTLVHMYNLILLNQKENKLEGRVGEFYQGILSKKNTKSNCNLIPTSTIGGRLANGTPYGALGHLIRQEADTYFRKEAPFYLDSKNLLLSNPVGNDEIMVTHLFRKKNNQICERNLRNGLLKFLNQDLLIYSFLTSFLIIIILIFFLQYQNFNSIFTIKNLKEIIQIFLFFFNLNNRIYLVKIIVFLSISHKIIFEFYKVLQFNSIKTNNVIVDTKELIKNLDDVFKTPKEVCFMKGEIDSYLFQSAPKQSIMNKIWLTKNSKKGVCLFKKDLSDQNLVLNVDKYFMLSKKSTAHFLVRVMSRHIPSTLGLWMNDNFIIYDFFLSFYMKQSIHPDKRKWIDNIVNIYMQSSLMNPEGNLTLIFFCTITDFLNKSLLFFGSIKSIFNF